MTQNEKSQRRRSNHPVELKDFYSEFSKALLLRQEEILRQADVTRSHLDQQIMELPGDTADESVLDVSADYFFKLAQHHQQELLEIRNAFERMHRGSYGICADCEIPISIERLKHLPYAQCCVNCQSIREKKRLKSA